jgi:hypothetical protein
MTKDLKAPPANISEFTTITGLVFTQLYEQFPVAVTLDRAAIESAMRVASSSSHVLQSLSFADQRLANARVPPRSTRTTYFFTEMSFPAMPASVAKSRPKRIIYSFQIS